MEKISKYRFLLISILVHTIWFCAALYWKHIYNGDSYEYYYLGQNILNGFYYSGNPVLPIKELLLSIRTPLYAWFVQIIHFFVNDSFAVLVVQNIISIITCFYVHNIFTKYVGKCKKWMYWFFVLTHPAQLMSANMIVPDTLLQLFLMLYFGSLIQYIYTGKLRLFVGMSLWLVLAMATKPVVYPVIILHAAYGLWQAVKRKYVWTFALAIMPTLAVIAYGKWQEKRTGIFHISSVQPHNQINFWIRYYHNEKYGLSKADSMNKQMHSAIQLEPDFAARYAKASSIAKDTIVANFWSYSVFHGIKTIRYYIEPGKGELDLFTDYSNYSSYFQKQKNENFQSQLREGGIYGAWQYMKNHPFLPFILCVVFINIIRLIGGFIFIFDKKQKLILRIIVLIWFAYFAVVSGPTSNVTRYITPVLPILSACAAIGWSIFPAKRESNRSIE